MSHGLNGAVHVTAQRPGAGSSPRGTDGCRCFVPMGICPASGPRTMAPAKEAVGSRKAPPPAFDHPVFQGARSSGAHFAPRFRGRCRGRRASAATRLRRPLLARTVAVRLQRLPVGPASLTVAHRPRGSLHRPRRVAHRGASSVGSLHRRRRPPWRVLRGGAPPPWLRRSPCHILRGGRSTAVAASPGGPLRRAGTPPSVRAAPPARRCADSPCNGCNCNSHSVPSKSS